MASGTGTQYIKTGGESPVRQWWGVYYAYIAVNTDPLAQGRVKLRVPQVFGATTSGWAAPMVPLSYIPRVGTPVTVMFVGGDPTQPVWFGNFALPDGAAGFVIAATAPASPEIGEVWVNTATGLMSEWNGVAWVGYLIGGSAIQTGAALSAPNITGGVITGAKFVGSAWIEDADGSFFYDGTLPLPGVMIGSITNGTVDDPATGTPTAGGISSYGPDGYVSLFGGEINFGENAYMSIGSSGVLTIGSGAGAGVNSINCLLPFGTVLVPVEPGTTAAFETWHSLGTCGSTGCTLEQARYRLTIDGECEIDIAMLAGASGSTAGTYTFTTTLAVAYQFPGNFIRVYPLAYNTTITGGAQNAVIAVDGNGTGSPGRVRITIPALASGVYITGTVGLPLS